MNNSQMDEKSVLNTDNRILFGLKKEINSDTCYNMDETWGQAKWNKPITKGQMLYDSTCIWYLVYRVVKFIGRK